MTDKIRGVITIGYSSYVMDAHAALEVMRLLSGAEVVDSKWDSDAKTNYQYINRTLETGLRVVDDVEYNKMKIMGDVITKERNGATGA